MREPTSTSQTKEPTGAWRPQRFRTRQQARPRAPAWRASGTSQSVSLTPHYVRIKPEALVGLRSGDGPLSVRARPSSLMDDCGRRTTSAGGRCLVNVHAKSCLTLEPLCGHSGQKPRARREPARTDAGHPLQASGSHGASFMIRNIRGMNPASLRINDRVRAGRSCNSLDCRGGLRSRERASLEATPGATGANNLQGIRTRMNSGQGRVRGHGPI